MRLCEGVPSRWLSGAIGATVAISFNNETAYFTLPFDKLRIAVKFAETNIKQLIDYQLIFNNLVY